MSVRVNFFFVPATMPTSDSIRTSSEPSSAPYEALVAVIRRLRKECPWDRQQTHESARHLVVEEAYETVDAIEQGDYDELKKELGDLVLQVIFHSVIAEEAGRFTLAEVMAAVREKLIRRHPHVYGDVDVTGVNQVLSNWEEIKRKERPGRRVLDGISAHMPALLCAHRMQEKAAGVGFDFETEADTWAKVEEELREYREAAGSTQAEGEFGDLLFALVNYARRTDINAENALRSANSKFKRRFSYIESKLEGRRLRAVSLAEMDRYWEEAKRFEELPSS